MEQPSQHRYVLHLLYVNTILRGGSIDHYSSPYIRPASPIEVVEELNPVSGVKVELKISKPIKKVTLEPQGRELPFEMLSNGRVAIDVGTFTCHQMVVLHY
jgi:hypothetical protein